MRPLSTWRALNRTFGGGVFPTTRILQPTPRFRSTIESTSQTIKQYAYDAERAARDGSRSKRLLFASVAAVTLGVGAYTISDDARHIYYAAQRAGRVASTLFVCINECVTIYAHSLALADCSLTVTESHSTTSTIDRKTMGPFSKPATSAAPTVHSSSWRRMALYS